MTRISAIAEIISSVAIVLTLVYLTIETRQNTEALHASSREVTLMMDVQFLLTSMENPTVALLGNKEELSELEANQLATGLSAFLRIREYSYIQYEAGILDEATLASYNNATPLVLGSEFARNYWASISQRLHPGFVSYTNQLLEESAATMRQPPTRQLDAEIGQ